MEIYKRTIKDTRLLPENAVILDVTASGHYARTGSIEELSVLSRKDGVLCETILSSEAAADEPEILTRLAEELGGIRSVITFNGQSFDLPFLRRKYESHNLPDPLDRKAHTDLFRVLRPLKRIFALPSEKLSDYYAFTGISAEEWLIEDPDSPESSFRIITDALRTLAALGLEIYLDAFKGKGTLESACLEDGHLYLSIRLPRPCPRDISVHDTIYHVRFTGSEMKIGMPVENDRVRIYHTDLGSYVYLPNEGYAVHKSVARFVDPSRCEKVTRETCFHYAVVNESLIRNTEWTEKLTSSVLSYMLTR